MPRTPVTIPELGEMIRAVRIVRWLKAAGQPVTRDEDLLEITTDKTDAVLNAPASGVLAAITHGDGERVPIGSVVGFIDP